LLSSRRTWFNLTLILHYRCNCESQHTRHVKPKDVVMPDHQLAASPASALPTALQWGAALLMGPLGTAIAVLAVASVGLLMMQGRLPLRTGARITMGCFILFGAPCWAKGLLSNMPASFFIGPPATQSASATIRTPSDAVTRTDPFAGQHCLGRGLILQVLSRQIRKTLKARARRASAVL
jgi:type IV secretory pathway VirB2 component (pilin)